MTINTTPAPISGPAAAGPPGPQGLWPEGEWAAGTKIKNTVLSHNNRVWVANKTTTQEPSDSASDWDLWIDAQGAELAGGYAEAADAARALAVAAKNDTLGIKSDTQTIADNVAAAERRIRAQDLGDFATDAAALAWAAAQTPPISVVVGSSYWNTATLIKRICSDSTTTPKTFVDEDADAATQRANAATSATASQNALQDFLNRYVGAYASAPSYVGGSPPWVNGALYWNTVAGKFKVWTGATWVDSDAVAVQAAADATAILTTIYGFWCGAAAADPTTKIGGGALTTSCIYINTVSGKLRTYATGAWVDYDKAAQDALTAATAQATIATTQASAAATTKGQVDAAVGSLASISAFAQPYLLDGLAPAAIFSAPKGLAALNGAVVSIASLLLFSSAAKYTTRPDGKLIQNAANGPAYSWINGRRQLVIEPAAATNYWLNSETEVQPGSIGAGILTGSIQAGYFGAVMGNRLTSVNGATANMGWKGKSISANETVSFDFLLQAEAGGITSMKAGIWGSVDGYGGNTGAGADNIATILSGPGAIAYAGGMVTISGLSTATPTKVRIWRTMANAQTAQGGFNVPFTAVGQTIMLGALNFQSGYGSSYIPCGATATARAADVVTFAAGLLALFTATNVTVALRGIGAQAGWPIVLLGSPNPTPATIGVGSVAVNGGGMGALYGADASSLNFGTYAPGSANFGVALGSTLDGKRKASDLASAIASDNHAHFAASMTALKLGTGALWTTPASLLFDEIVVWPFFGSDAGLQGQARVYS